MPGIDRQDQYMATYSTKRLRLKRVYRLLYMLHLEMSEYNSYVTFCHLMNRDRKKYPYLEFKENLFIQTLRYYRPEITDRTLTLPVQSWPDPAPVTNEIRYDLSLGHWMAKLGTTLQEN